MLSVNTRFNHCCGSHCSLKPGGLCSMLHSYSGVSMLVDTYAEEKEKTNTHWVFITQTFIFRQRHGNYHLQRLRRPATYKAEPINMGITRCGPLQPLLHSQTLKACGPSCLTSVGSKNLQLWLVKMHKSWICQV